MWTPRHYSRDAARAEIGESASVWLLKCEEGHISATESTSAIAHRREMASGAGSIGWSCWVVSWDYDRQFRRRAFAAVCLQHRCGLAAYRVPSGGEDLHSDGSFAYKFRLCSDMTCICGAASVSCSPSDKGVHHRP